MTRFSSRLHANWVTAGLVGGALVAAIAATPPPAHAVLIYPSFDSGYYQCQTTLQPFQQAHLFVTASYFGGGLSDPSTIVQGIVGAEFRVEGLPATGFFTQVDAAPGASLTGDPLGSGCQVSFPACRGWDTSQCTVPLLVITVLPLGPVPDLTLMVRGPGDCNPFSATPRVTLCDAPTSTLLCAPGTGVCVNGFLCLFCPVAKSAGCVLAVTPATWSGVKALYRDDGR